MKVQGICLGLSLFLLGLGSATVWADSGQCSFDSDCGDGVKCRSGKCATAAGGSCSFDSDCGGGKCRSGKCANSPGGSCSFDSDCGAKGKCRSGKCAGSGAQR